MRQTFIVTGGAGLIGANIVAGLNRRGETDILVVDHGKVIARGDSRSLKRQVGGDNIGLTVTDDADLDPAADLLARVTGNEVVLDRPVRTAVAPTAFT